MKCQINGTRQALWGGWWWFSDLHCTICVSSLSSSVNVQHVGFKLHSLVQQRQTYVLPQFQPRILTCCFDNLLLDFLNHCPPNFDFVLQGFYTWLKVSCACRPIVCIQCHHLGPDFLHKRPMLCTRTYHKPCLKHLISCLLSEYASIHAVQNKRLTNLIYSSDIWLVCTAHVRHVKRTDLWAACSSAW